MATRYRLTDYDDACLSIEIDNASAESSAIQLMDRINLCAIMFADVFILVYAPLFYFANNGGT